MTLAKVRVDDIGAETTAGGASVQKEQEQEGPWETKPVPGLHGGQSANEHPAGIPRRHGLAWSERMGRLEISAWGREPWGCGTWNPRVCGTVSEQPGGFQELGCVTLGPRPSRETALSLV